MTKSTRNLLLYVAETLLESLKSDLTANDQEQVRILGKRVEAMGRYLQSRRTGPGYMKMTKSEFLLLHENEEDYDFYVCRADDIESEGGFLSE